MNNYFPSSVIVNDFEFTNVPYEKEDSIALIRSTAGQLAIMLNYKIVIGLCSTKLAMFHHHGEEFDDHFRTWSKQYLSFPTSLGVTDAF